METPNSPLSIENRLRDGLSRIAAVLRADEWNRAKTVGLNPAQLGILVLLQGRSDGLGVGEIAAHLGVSQPSASDSINTLEKKGCVEKRSGAGDGRSVRVSLTDHGIAVLHQDGGPDLVGEAIAALDDCTQQDLLVTLITLIRHLQEKNAIPVQRMCVSCRHFAAFVHADEERPHHCHFVNAAFGQRELRVDCQEHEPTDPASRAATWDAFTKGMNQTL